MKLLKSPHIDRRGAEPNADREAFRIRDKILLLRLFRLGHLPSAVFSAQLSIESGLPVLAVEYGNIEESRSRVPGDIPRIRLSNSWVRATPRPTRSVGIFVGTLFQLIRRIAQEGQPRVIVAHGLNEQVLAYILHLLFRIPYVVHVHEVFDRAKHQRDRMTPFNRLLFSFEGLALRNAAHLIFPELGRADVYGRRYRLKCPIFVASNCPRLRRKGRRIDLRARHGLPETAILMLYVGGIGDVNAVREAVGALREMPSLHFLVLGWGDKPYLDSLREDARRLGVESRLVLAGEVEDKWEYLDNCDLSYCVYRPITLRTRHLATASNKFTESMAAGLPVITTDHADFKSIVERFDLGVCLTELTEVSIAKAVRSLIEDRPGLARRARNAIECHRSQFHYEAQYAAPLAEMIRLFGVLANPTRGA